jgi:PucR family transcriptional regulator, purine catabolism regulatory protein
MADITIHDVLAWEPRLHLVRRPLPGMAASDDIGDREVSWAVTVRAAAPMLNPLRGGELVLLPNRVLAESGVALPVLLRELASHNVSAAVLESPPTVASPLPVLVVSDLSVEFETELNRMLTERRGDLYRTGTELGRVLNTAANSHNLAALIRTAGSFLGCPVAVMSARGSVIERTDANAVPSGGARAAHMMVAPREWRDTRLLVRLTGGELLWLGPVAYDNRALIRLAADRLAVTIESLLQRSAEDRPRGQARATALNALLQGSAEMAERGGPLLGLPQEGAYRVVLASATTEASGVLRSLHAFGETFEAGSIGGWWAFVLRQRADSAGHVQNRVGAGPPQIRVSTTESVCGSGVVNGVEHLPEALRQAQYVATLVEHGVIAAGSAFFDRLTDVGVLRLLYELLGNPALSSYIEDALGDLRTRDKRGTLRKTLLVYLNSGGSNAETAAALGIHRNTLTYRLRQIERLSGRDPNDPAMRLAIHIALVAEMLPSAE